MSICSGNPDGTIIRLTCLLDGSKHQSGSLRQAWFDGAHHRLQLGSGQAQGERKANMIFETMNEE